MAGQESGDVSLKGGRRWSLNAKQFFQNDQSEIKSVGIFDLLPSA
jgi:hypothetical protein